MGLNDEDEDLVALRHAALSTMNAKRASENAMKLKSSGVSSGGVSIRDGFGNQNNALFQPHYNSNLIAIVPISPSTEADQPRPRRVAFRHQQQQLNKLILPQHRYCKTEEAIPRKKEKPAVKTKFNRYDSSSSDSSEESEDEGSTASGEKAAAVKTPVDRQIKDDSVVKEVPGANPPSDTSDLDSEPSFFVELESDTKQEKDNGPAVAAPVVFSDSKGSQETLVNINKDLPFSQPPKENVILATQSPPKTQRSPHYLARSRSKSPFYSSRPYVERSRSRSRSRSRPRLGRSRSPRRYGPRRSVSPKRRAVSPRYISPRRRSPLGGRLSPHGHPSPTDRFSTRRRSSPSDRLSPGRRRLSSPRRPLGRVSPPRRYGSPPSPRRRSSPFDRMPSPHRRAGDRSSPWRRLSPSPPRRHYSPSGRLSPRRPSPARRRKSPSPVKRNPSPPRRFSPQRRSPLGRRVSPPRRNPSPPRKLYPVAGQPARLHSPRRYPSSPVRGVSPRRYNGQSVGRASPTRPNPGSGDMSPWSPPRNSLHVVSPRFARKRSISPRPRNRRGSITPPFIKGERKSVSPRPLKRRDSGSPRFEPRKGSVSPKFVGKRRSVSPRHIKKGSLSPRLDYKRRKPVSPRLGHRRGSTSPNFVGSRRKSISPRADNRKAAPASPRFVPKRRRSFSPKGPRLGSKKRSNSPSSFERRLRNSPAQSRRLDERDARTAICGPRDVTTRDNSKSLSLSPPPERVKVKSPLRVRAHRHERANGKKRTKSKKSRDKTSAPSAEKTEKTGEKSSVLEARRKKFESVDPIKPVNKKIRLKTAAEELPADTSPKVDEGEKTISDETENTVDDARVQEEDDDEDALVLDSPANLWSDEESDSGNEGRFKSAGRGDANTRKVGVLSFKNLLQPSTKPEPKRIRDRIGTRERRSPAREKKRRRDKGVRERLTAGSVLDRIGERGAWKARRGTTVLEEAVAGLPDTGTSPDRLPALLSKEILKPEQNLKSSDVDEATPDPTERVSRLDSTDQHGDLRAALSRKRAARSNILFPFKVGDKGKVPGSRLVQSAFLDAVGKKQKRSKKTLSQPSLPKLANNLAGAANDARRVTLYNKVKASVKQLSESVTLATDESTLTCETHYSDDEMTRKPPVRLRLGLPLHAEDYPGGRKVKLKRSTAASDQV